MNFLSRWLDGRRRIARLTEECSRLRKLVGELLVERDAARAALHVAQEEIERLRNEDFNDFIDDRGPREWRS